VIRYIDADGHALEPRDLWVKNLPPRFRADAVQVVWNPDTQYEMVVGEGRILLSAGVAAAGLANQPWDDMARGIRYDGDQVAAGGFDPRARMTDMAKHGIDLSFVFPTLGLTVTGLRDPVLAQHHCRVLNDWIADYCSVVPNSLAGIATLPLQDIDLAAKEARRAVSDLGLRGVFIRPNPYGDRHLDSPKLDPLWRTIQELGVPVCLHPGGAKDMWGFFDFAERFPVAPALAFGFPVAFGFDMQYAWTLMVGSGVFDRFPDLRVGLMETGGGWMAHWLVRTDHMYDTYSWAQPRLEMRPSEYFRRNGHICFDPDEQTLPATAAIVGVENILWASDYPHQDLRSECVRDELDATLEPLSVNDRVKIIQDNALTFYKSSSTTSRR
jgi:predicted TIM-barrel fold metal-dependent hydrolase